MVLTNLNLGTLHKHSCILIRYIVPLWFLKRFSECIPMYLIHKNISTVAPPYTQGMLEYLALPRLQGSCYDLEFTLHENACHIDKLTLWFLRRFLIFLDILCKSLKPYYRLTLGATTRAWLWGPQCEQTWIYRRGRLVVK